MTLAQATSELVDHGGGLGMPLLVDLLQESGPNPSASVAARGPAGTTSSR